MNALTGTLTLIRFILRRDRIRLPIWIGGIVGFFVLVALSFPEIYQTAEDRQARARLMENPTAVAFRGPGHGLEDYTYGAMLANELMLFAIVGVALMSIFTVIRHTRGEEESGRLELVRAAVVGRYAAPTAALVVVSAANLVAGLGMALLLASASSMYPLTGALAFGLAVSASGLAFTGVALVTAQLTEHGRGASGMAALVLGVAVLIRAIGDIRGDAISWFSPIGWSQASRAFVDEQWWPLLLSAGFLAIMVGLAWALIDRRDVGAGLLPQKPGPATATAFASTPFGFAFRQQRGSLIGWSLGLMVIAVAFGSLAGEVEEFIGDSPQLADFLAAEGVSLLEAFLAMIMLVMSLLAAGFGIQSISRARSEETEGRAEPMLSTALSRFRWIGSYLLVAMLGSAVVLLTGGAALGGVAAIDQNDTSLLTGTVSAALVYILVIWLLIGLSALLFGLIPRLMALTWLVLIYGFFVGLFGEQVQLPAWMFNLSPWEHVPELPGNDFAVLPMAVVLVIAAVLIATGIIGFRRRDLEMS